MTILFRRYHSFQQGLALPSLVVQYLCSCVLHSSTTSAWPCLLSTPMPTQRMRGFIRLQHFCIRVLPSAEEIGCTAPPCPHSCRMCRACEQITEPGLHLVCCSSAISALSAAPLAHIPCGGAVQRPFCAGLLILPLHNVPGFQRSALPV